MNFRASFPALVAIAFLGGTPAGGGSVVPCLKQNGEARLLLAEIQRNVSLHLPHTARRIWERIQFASLHGNPLKARLPEFHETFLWMLRSIDARALERPTGDLLPEKKMGWEFYDFARTRLQEIAARSRRGDSYALIYEDTLESAFLFAFAIDGTSKLTIADFERVNGVAVRPWGFKRDLKEFLEYFHHDVSELKEVAARNPAQVYLPTHEALSVESFFQKGDLPSKETQIEYGLLIGLKC